MLGPKQTSISGLSLLHARNHFRVTTAEPSLPTAVTLCYLAYPGNEWGVGITKRVLSLSGRSTSPPVWA